jgi:hypothetical protein
VDKLNMLSMASRASALMSSGIVTTFAAIHIYLIYIELIWYKSIAVNEKITEVFQE